MASQPPVTEEVAQESLNPLKYKTWTLKVSVHCEGCKRKVRKILLGIEGVYTVDVETKLHKATVTGNVESETLIRKLEKSGKHAELWAEKEKNDEQKESKRSKKKKNKPNDGTAPDNNNNNEDSSAPAEQENGEPNAAAKPGCNVQFSEVIRVETNPPVPENKPAEGPTGTVPNAGGGGGGGGKKKKKKGKGNSGNGNGNGNGGDPVSNGNGNGNVGDAAAAQGQGPAPRSYPVYEQAAAYYAAPPLATPVYAVSYNTAYPASSYTASYYANPVPQSYAYLHQGSDSAEGGASPSDSFEIFSDENPNACSLM